MKSNRILSSDLQTLLVASAFAALLFSATSLPAQQRQVLQTAISARTDAKPLSRVPPTQTLNLALTLSLRNQGQLQTLLKHLYDPASPNYRQFLSVEQFTEQYGPTTSDYEKAIAFATTHGLTVTNKTPNRLVLDVRGTVAQIEQAFDIEMHIYQHPTENRTYYAPDVEPSVEAGVPIQGISGLNNFEPPRPMGLKYAKKDELYRSNQTGSGPDGFFLGSDMRAAYAPGTSLTGAGQAVGLFEFGPYNLSDVQNYFSFISQPLNVPIVNVLVDGVSPVCGAGCDDGEEVIDIQQAVSMAPGMSAIIVYEGNDDTDMFNQMATDNVAKQLSCSFGFLPADPMSDEPIFMEFAAQGQNLFIASGDGGAYYGDPIDCGNFSNLNGCIFYPADDPFVTAVGGTDLVTNGGAGPWLSETGWIGSGGGYSTNGFAIPSYQVPVINSSNQGSTTLRNIPDVAAEANTDNFFCANGGCFIGVGGTSLAAPRWAGFMALANEQANGHAIGFLNPTIYSIGQGPDYATDVHDITSGNNFNSGSPSTFSATTGFDLVAGWGSPNGPGLLNALGPAPSGPNFALAASPATINATQGSSGTSTIVLNAISGFTGTVSLSVVVLGQPTGVTAVLSPTSIAGSESSTLSISTTSSTPGGNFPIVVTGTSSGITQTAYLTLALPGFTLTGPSEVFVNQGGTATGTITINPVNGFSGTVKLSRSGLPAAVTASFNPPHTASTSQITFTARGNAATGTASVTVTGISGNITQTATINLAVSAATGTGGSGTLVDLSSAFRVFGIHADGTKFGAGLDGGGAAFSANLLTPSRILTGTQFVFGPANKADAVCDHASIPLPAGNFKTLRMLATGLQGNQMGKTVTVTYTDGTVSEFIQNFSDWYTPQNFSGEVQAVVMAYRDIFDGSEDTRPFNLYGYTFHLKSGKTVQSLALPADRDVCTLAVTLSENN